MAQSVLLLSGRWQPAGVLGLALALALGAVGCDKARDKLGIPKEQPRQQVDPNVDADRNLLQIAQAAERLASAVKTPPADFAVFPPAAPPTPVAPACEDGKPVAMPIRDEDWAHPTWKALGFKPRRASRFQYSFVSNGRSFTARAVGDLDCDGTAVTFEKVGFATPLLERCREAINRTLAHQYYGLSPK